MNYFVRMLVALLCCLPCSLSMRADGDAHRFTLVIDAGHGGHDAGAVGAISKEKNINLNVALAFGRLVEANCPDVRVVYTRKTDIFIPLQTRADIANNCKADLFISIHTNAVPKGKIARGAETYTLGIARADANLEVAKRENSVITYEANYRKVYEGFDPSKVESYIIFELMQDQYMQQSVELARLIQQQYVHHAGRNNKGVHQAGFLVLRKTSMPAVLTELGFISTPEEERYLNSEQGIRQMSQSLYNGFVNYRAKHDKKAPAPRLIADEGGSGGTQPTTPTGPAKTDTTTRKKADPQPTTTDGTDAAGRTGGNTRSDLPTYKVQLFVVDRPLKDGDRRFCGLQGVSYYRENGMYKYTYGETTDYNEARRLQRSVADKFSSAFIVAFRDSRRMDLQEALRITRSRQTK